MPMQGQYMAMWASHSPTGFMTPALFLPHSPPSFPHRPRYSRYYYVLLDSIILDSCCSCPACWWHGAGADCLRGPPCSNLTLALSIQEKARVEVEDDK